MTASDSPLLIDRARCWRALQLRRWVTDRMYFFNGYVDGDGGAAQFAFARAGTSLTLARRPRTAPLT